MGWVNRGLSQLRVAFVDNFGDMITNPIRRPVQQASILYNRLLIDHMTVAIAHVVFIFFAWKQVSVYLIIVLRGWLLINSRLTFDLLNGDYIRVCIRLHQIVPPWVVYNLSF